MTTLLAGATAGLLNTSVLAVTVASVAGNIAFAVFLARTERQADQRTDRDAQLIKELNDDLRALARADRDREHREAELEAVLARKNQENEALSAVALEHADLTGIRVFTQLPHEQWPATVNGTRP